MCSLLVEGQMHDFAANIHNNLLLMVVLFLKYLGILDIKHSGDSALETSSKVHTFWMTC